MTAAQAWTTANVAEPLRDDEVHVWRLSYRREFGRAPLLALLATYLGVDAGDVALVEGEFGRPMLGPAHDPALNFNWSHSGDQAVIAIARHITPGIDLERLRERPRALEIARRYFDAAEAEALAALPLAASSAAFLELWTAKEAVLKAVGRGIAFGLHRLRISRANRQLELEWLDGDLSPAWQLRRLDLGEQHVAALAWRGAPRKIRLNTLVLRPDQGDVMHSAEAITATGLDVVPSAAVQETFRSP